jgi:hypothetical protein
MAEVRLFRADVHSDIRGEVHQFNSLGFEPVEYSYSIQPAQPGTARLG